MADNLIVETRGKIRIITLNRPKVGNALLFSQFGALVDALNDATEDDFIKAVVIAANGPFFCVGADGAEIAKASAEGVASLQKELREGPVKLTRAIHNFQKIIVALVNGPAVGYFAGALTCFDLVLCSPQAAWQPQFLHMGICPEGGCSFALTKIVGWQKAMDILLSNKRLDANEMVAMGIAAQNLPAANFRENGIMAVEKVLAQVPFSALVATKGIMRETFPEMLRSVELEGDGIFAQAAIGAPQEMFARKMKELATKKRQKAKL